MNDNRQRNNSKKYTNSIFEESWWLDTVSPNTWKEIFIKKDDKVAARWAVPIQKKKIRMPKLTQTIGFWIDPYIIENDHYLNEQKNIILELIDKLPSKNTVLDLDSKNHYFLPFIWKGFSVKPCVSYRINDLSNINAVYARFNKIVKKNIKAGKNKCSVQEIDDISILYELMRKTFQLQKRKYPIKQELLENIYSACKKHNACKLIYAVDNEKNVHSGALFVYDERVCYYLVAGTDPKFRSSGANSLLIWEGIKFASTVSKVFDFEGSMIEGIEHFIRQFNATPTLYYNIRNVGIAKELFEVFKPKIKRLIGYKI